MEKGVSSLANYEKDFILFQKKLGELRGSNPNKFIAFKDGKVISVDESIETIKSELISKGVEPSVTVIEFVSKDDICIVV